MGHLDDCCGPVASPTMTHLPDPAEVAKALEGFPTWSPRPVSNDTGDRDEWDRRRHLERKAARAYADSEEVCEYRLRPWRICGVSRTAHSPDVEGHEFVPGLLVFTDRQPARLIVKDTDE